jgi:hypothetical protein
MHTRAELQRIRSTVVAGSVFGLCIAIALGIGILGGGSAPNWQKGIFAIAFSAPFIVALGSARLNRVAHQRIGWAVASALSAALGVALFTGVGIFYLALALGYAWAVVAAGRADPNVRTHRRHSAPQQPLSSAEERG